MRPLILILCLSSLSPLTAQERGVRGEAPVFFAEIDCRSDALAAGHRLRLRDIATVRTPDPQWTEALLNVEIGHAPQPGHHRVIQRGAIASALVRHGQKTRNLKFRGAERVFVKAHSATVTSEELQAAGRKVIEQAILQQTGGDISYELQQTPNWIKIPFGRRNRSLRPVLVDGKLQQNHAAVRVELLVDGKPYKSVRLNYRLTRFIKVLSLNRTVQRGERITGEMIDYKRIDATQGDAGHLVSMADVRGKACAARLSAGTLLREHHLMRPILVRKDDIVTLHIIAGRLRMRTQMRALGEGGVGEFIEVERLSPTRQVAYRRRDKTRRVLHARVVEAGHVVIQEK